LQDSVGSDGHGLNQYKITTKPTAHYNALRVLIMPTSKKAFLDLSYDEFIHDGKLIRRDASFEREYIMSEEGFARIQAMPLFDVETAGACSFDDIDASQKNDKNKMVPAKSPMRESPTATDKSLAAEALRQLMSTSVRHSPLQVSRGSIFQNPVNDNQAVQFFEQSPAIMQRSPSYVVSPSASVPQPPFYAHTDPNYAKANVPQYDHKVRFLKHSIDLRCLMIVLYLRFNLPPFFRKCDEFQQYAPVFESRTPFPVSYEPFDSPRKRIRDKQNPSFSVSCEPYDSPHRRIRGVDHEFADASDGGATKRGKYKCSYCGQMKANHVCSVVCTKNEGAQTEFTGCDGKVSSRGVRVIVVGGKDATTMEKLL